MNFIYCSDIKLVEQLIAEGCEYVKTERISDTGGFKTFYVLQPPQHFNFTKLDTSSSFVSNKMRF